MAGELKLAGAQEDADHDSVLAGPVLPVVRNAGLLDDRVTWTQHNLAASDDKRHLAAQDCHVIQRVSRVRSLELGMLVSSRLTVRCVRAVGAIRGIRGDLDDAEAGCRLQAAPGPTPRWRCRQFPRSAVRDRRPTAQSWCTGPRG